MCFLPQRRALFRHRNFQTWSDNGVFCTFWLGNVLRATTACTFSTSQLPKVVREWCVLYILAAVQSCSSKLLPKAAPRCCSPILLPKVAPKAVLQNCCPKAATLQTCSPKCLPKAILQSGSRKLLPKVASQSCGSSKLPCQAAPQSCSPGLLPKAVPQRCSPKLCPKLFSKAGVPKLRKAASQNCCRKLLPKIALQSYSPYVLPKARFFSKLPCKAAPQSCSLKLLPKAVPRRYSPKLRPRLFSKVVTPKLRFGKPVYRNVSPKPFCKTAPESCASKLLLKAAVQKHCPKAATLQTYMPKRLPKAILQNGFPACQNCCPKLLPARNLRFFKPIP